MKGARRRQRCRGAAALLALWVAGASTPAAAQPASAAASIPCTTPANLAPAQLYGRWQLALWPQSAETGAQTATTQGAFRFERHPEFPDSVRGTLLRTISGQPAQALVSGDVISGEFNLDESADGQRIDAVWTGDVTPAGCGREIRGVRLPAQGQAGEPMNFVLTKAPGWD
jgi:hypothetical protein